MISSSVRGEECRGLGTASTFIGRTILLVEIYVWPNVASSSLSNTRWCARNHRRRPRFPWGMKTRGTQNLGATSFKDKEHKNLRATSSKEKNIGETSSDSVQDSYEEQEF